MADYIAHHGILGMKWGVRRYRNYDGSYTKKGLEHYRESEKKYNKAKEMHKTAKNLYRQTKRQGYGVTADGRKVTVTKNVVKESKRLLKDSKRQLSRDYDQLKRDKAGDIGKELYRSGKTITGNENNLRAAGLIATGTVMASQYLAESGRSDLAKKTAAIGVGLEAVNAILGVKNAVEAHYLRAYYGHSRGKTNPR